MKALPRRIRVSGFAAAAVACVVSLTISAPVSAQSLEERAQRLDNAEQYILEQSRRTREALRKQEAELAGKPENRLPEDYRAPWIYEPTLERRAEEEDWPAEYRAKRQQEMKKIQPEAARIPWFSVVSRQHAAREEIGTKFNWLQDINGNLSKKLERMKTLQGAERQVLEKEIKHDVELAERLSCSFIDCRGPAASAPAESAPDQAGAAEQAAATTQPMIPERFENPVAPEPQPQPQAAGQGEKPRLQPMEGFASGLLNQASQTDRSIREAAEKADPARKQAQAQEAFGEGKAGGGGVSLHKPARISGPLDPADVTKAVVEKGRLTLVMKSGSRIRMPALSLDDVAVAIRVVYGRPPAVSGELIATDGEAVIVKTGPEKYGDVVWRNSNLSQPIELPEAGSPVALDIAPAVGIMNLPEPSVGRITYYGDILGTHIGHVISKSDQVILQFFTGYDVFARKPSPRPPIEGFMTSLEIRSRIDAGQMEVPLRSAGKPPLKGDKYKDAWWRDSTFFVWVIGDADFSYDEKSGEIVPDKVNITMQVWSPHPYGPDPIYFMLADSINANLDAIIGLYPILRELSEVAKTVSLVRWLKSSGIKADLAWAEAYKTEHYDTAERTPRIFVVQIHRQKKPVFRKAKAD